MALQASHYRTSLQAVAYVTPFLAIGLLSSFERQIPQFLVLFTLSFALYWFHWVRAGRVPTMEFILIVGILARFAVLAIEPCDDMNRYLWEAKVWLNGFNPYQHAPNADILHPLRDSYWVGINHPYFPAIYPPLAQLHFILTSSLLHNPLMYKLTFLAWDVAAFTFFVKISRHMGLGGREAALYFLNPLLILEVSGRGHFESLLLAWMLLALLLLLRGRPFAALTSLGAGAMTKIFSTVLWPLWVHRYGWKAIGPIMIWATALGTIMWFLGIGQSLLRFGTGYSYNGIANGILTRIWPRSWPDDGIRLLLYVLMSVCLVFVLYRSRRQEILRFGFGLMLWLILFLPTLHSWYLLWALPFAALYRSRPFLLLTATTALSYVVTYQWALTGEWRAIDWLWWPQYIPPFALWIYEESRRFFGSRKSA